MSTSHPGQKKEKQPPHGSYLPTLPFQSIAKTYIQETRSLVHGPARLGLPDFGYSCSVSVLEVRHSWTIMDNL